MLCKKCGRKLTGKQTKFCSKKCSKNFLKSEYRKRNKEKVNSYNREYRSACARRPLNRIRRTNIIEQSGNKCSNCGVGGNIFKLEVHHIKPLIKGGTHIHSNLLVLCKNCHQEWEKRMKDYWM